MKSFNLNIETFYKFDADPADTVQTVTDSMRYGHITDRTNRYRWAIRSIHRIRICVCDWSLTKTSCFPHIT